jgi:hypothetical protein
VCGVAAILLGFLAIIKLGAVPASLFHRFAK